MRFPVSRLLVLLGWFSISMFFSGELCGVIIVVHGTFASSEKWHQTDGDFVQALRSSFALLPDSCPQKNAPIVSFVWSGANCSSARITAAKNLAALIASYPVNEKIYLVAHSHAGNVVALTTHLFKKAAEIDLAQEVRSVCSWQIGLQEMSGLVGLPCSAMDYFLLQQAVQELCDVMKNVRVKTRALDPVGGEPRKFERIYFLATPVDVSRYLCEMSVVGACYALYSRGDWIQPVGGFYKRTFPSGPHVLNVEVVGIVSEKKVQLFGHTDLRKPRIGQWLLLLPLLIEESLGMRPGGYENHKSVVLALFSKDARPVVTTHVFEKDGKLNEVLKKQLTQINGEVLEAKSQDDIGLLEEQKGFVDPFLYLSNY